MREDGERDGGDARPGMPRALVGLAAFVATTLAALLLREIAGLVVPILFGLFLALIAAPAVRAFERRGVPHSLAFALTIGAVLTAVAIGTAVLGYSLVAFAASLPRYEDRFGDLVDLVRTALLERGIVADPAAFGEVLSPAAIVSSVRTLAGAVGDAGVGFLVLALTMVYALADGPGLRRRAIAAFGESSPLFADTARFGGELRRYLLVRTELGLFSAALTFGLLILLGIPFPLLWSFLVFAASFVPTIGGALALVPPVLLALLEAGPLMAGAVAAGYMAINFLQDQLLQPLLMGNELNMSPLLVFGSILVWTWILGPAGALLAVPMSAGLLILMEADPDTRRLGALLRARPGEPPVPPPPTRRARRRRAATGTR